MLMQEKEAFFINDRLEKIEKKNNGVRRKGYLQMMKKKKGRQSEGNMQLFDTNTHTRKSAPQQSQSRSSDNHLINDPLYPCC